MGIYTEAVQKLYVAYFSRPADAAGLTYWENVVTAANGNTTAVSAAFAGSQEYKDTFAGQSEYQIINTIYQNLFGRAAEPAALSFWGQGLINKSFTIDAAVTTIAGAAVGTDATAYKNKVAAATAFTAALDTTAEILGYQGTAANAAAKTWLGGITTDASLTAAIAPAALDASINGVVNAGNNATGQTYSLTGSLDTITGTAGNDSFIALVDGADDTLTLGDTINGGAGTDQIRITTDQADFTLGGTTITGVEELVVNSEAAGAQAASTADVNGVAFTKATFRGVAGVDGGDDTFVISNISKATTVVLQNVKNVGTTINYSNVTGTSDAATVEVAGSSDTTAGGDDENDLTVNGVENLTLNLTTAANDLDTITANAVKTVTINVSGGNARIEAAAGFGTANALNINAAKNLTLTAAASLANDAVITVTGAGAVDLATLDDNGAGEGVVVNASAHTGGLTVTGGANTVSITAGAGDDSITSASTTTAINAGEGDDRVSIGGNDYGNGLAATKTVAGGAGTDTLNVTVGGNLDANLLKKVTGFEVLSVAGGTGTYNLDKLGFDAVVVDADVQAAGVVVSNITDETLSITESVVTGALEFALKDATGEEDALTVTIEGAAALETVTTPTDLTDDEYDLTVGEIVIADVETVTLKSNTDAANVAGVNNVVSALSTNATALVVTGNHALEISAFNTEAGVAGNSSIETIDASESAGLIMTGFVEVANVSITGSAQADVLLVGDDGTNGFGSTINAGKGGDSVEFTAAGALDTVIVQAGDSQIGYVDADASGTFSAAVDVLKYDVVTGFTAGEDTLDVGSFNFSGNKASAVAAPTLSEAAAVNLVNGTTASISKFFVATGVQRGVAVVSGDFSDLGGTGTDSLVFVDTNGDGNLTVGTDEMILLVGTTGLALGDIGF